MARMKFRGIILKSATGTRRDIPWEIVIPGGCHAYFGCYGPQSGDGTPEISNEEQIEWTADAIAEMVEDDGR